MPQDTYTGKILSFCELLEMYRIEIPIIQRDYAQGRADNKEIRENFLNAIFDCINTDNPIQLDFIYGNIIENTLQPLDGQQRLTTLFLLHWYAATRSDIIKNSDIKKLLSQFSYETRISSREFCRDLIENNMEISTNDENIRESIIDSNWFFLSWKDDPTIDSMLRAIDDIHRIFFNINNLWNKLTNSEKRLITFYFVKLENIGLTDDLYIKMNARGKLLTPFENYKASLQKRIEKENWEEGISIEKTFYFKIDTTWTDFFWGRYKKNNSIDEALMRFIATIGMICQSVEKTEDRLANIKILQDDPNLVRSTHFSKAGFDYLVKAFNLFCVLTYNEDDLSLPFPMWRHTSKNSIISDIVFDINETSNDLKNSASYTQKVLFFAQLEYLKRNTYQKDKYHDWMRVIRNLISRGDIDVDGKRPDVVRSPQTFDGMINLIYELAEYSSDIYSELSRLGTLKSQFSKDQIDEEKYKSRIIVKKPDFRDIILEAEDNDLLRGRLDFIFYCMGDNREIENFDINLFIKLKNVFKNCFNSEASLTNDLRRAMLTVEVNGTYEFYNYWWSYWHLIGATKRKIFDKYRELEFFIYCDKKEYFKRLVEKLYTKDYKEIISEFVPPISFPNWKKRLIYDEKLLNEIAKSNYIAIADDNSCCWLLKSKRPRDEKGCYKVE